MNATRWILLALALAVSACSASHHQQDVAGEGDGLTVGVVQKDIHKGMAGAEVAEALGSPNIVTSDENGGEVWIYDRISTEKA